jgi:hypothetical protein
LPDVKVGLNQTPVAAGAPALLPGGDLFPHHVADDVRRGFMAGCRFGKQILIGQPVNGNQEGGVFGCLAFRNETRPIGSNFGSGFRPFFIRVEG